MTIWCFKIHSSSRCQQHKLKTSNNQPRSKSSWIRFKSPVQVFYNNTRTWSREIEEWASTSRVETASRVRWLTSVRSILWKVIEKVVGREVLLVRSSKLAIKSSLSRKLEHFLSQEESCLHQGFCKLMVLHQVKEFLLMRVKSEIAKRQTIKKARASTIQRSTISLTSLTARMVVVAAQIDSLLLIFKKSQIVVKAER